MFCVNCGKDIPEGHDFCGNCGAPAGKVLTQQPAQTAIKTNSKFTVGVVAVIIIIIAVFIIVRTANAGNEDSGVNMATAIAEEDILGEWFAYNEDNVGDIGIYTFRENGRLDDTRGEAVGNDLGEDFNWEFVGNDIIKISGRKKADKYAKVVFSKDKNQMLLIYYEKNVSDIIDTVAVYRRRGY